MQNSFQRTKPVIGQKNVLMPGPAAEAKRCYVDILTNYQPYAVIQISSSAGVTLREGRLALVSASMHYERFSMGGKSRVSEPV